MEKVLLYFAIFGLFFGVINTLDTSGGDMPYSMKFNLPTIYAQVVVNNALNEMEHAGINSMDKSGSNPTPETSLPKDDFKRLTSKDQAEFISRMSQQKNLARNDFLIGKQGIIPTLRGLAAFSPITSMVSWTIAGSIFYFIVKLFSSALH